jgi:hypothetical protein
MKLFDKKIVFGIDEIRGARNVFACCNETFNQRYSAEELLKIYRFMTQHKELSDTPDEWDNRHLAWALLGKDPDAAESFCTACGQNKSNWQADAQVLGRNSGGLLGCWKNDGGLHSWSRPK